MVVDTAVYVPKGEGRPPISIPLGDPGPSIQATEPSAAVKAAAMQLAEQLGGGATVRYVIRDVTGDIAALVEAPK